MPQRKRSIKPKVETKTCDLYPTLHKDVCQLLSEADLPRFKFYPVDDQVTCEKKFSTNIMGRFVCRNSKCPATGWSSKRIAIIIRLYPGFRYNARVYFQRCKSCEILSRPKLDDSYADRVAYRIKKWSGLEMPQIPWVKKKGKKPHNARLCEGCKDGQCKELGDD